MKNTVPQALFIAARTTHVTRRGSNHAMATTRSSKTSSTTTKRSSSSNAGSAGTRSAGTKAAGTRGHKSASTKTSSRGTAHRRTPAKASSKSSSAKSSSGPAHKTGSKTAEGQAWTDKHSDNPSSTGKGKAKKEPAKQTSQCWPGYESVPGKAKGTKGSCKPKAHQTGAEKKSDAMAAGASKLRKTGK